MTSTDLTGDQLETIRERDAPTLVYREKLKARMAEQVFEERQPTAKVGRCNPKGSRAEVGLAGGQDC